MATISTFYIKYQNHTHIYPVLSTQMSPGTLNSPSYCPFQMPRALCGWTCPRRWWRAAQSCCTARWTVTLLPRSPGCSGTRRFCGTRPSTSPSPWTMWRLRRRESTLASGTMATASWTPHCTWLSSVSLWDRNWDTAGYAGFALGV